MTLASIRERLEVATGPDRMLDFELARAFEADARWPNHYTASVDAALGLIERVLGGKIGPIGLTIAGGAQASIESPDPCGWSVQDIAPTAPIALLRALLSALAEGGEHE